jgi:hypothetical protein
MWLGLAASERRYNAGFDRQHPPTHAAADQPGPLPLKTARLVLSWPNMSALSMESSFESRVRARWTRLLIVPTGVAQMAAAS